MRGRPTSLQFTEEMKGFLTLGETDYDKGFRTGKANGTDAMVHLTIKADDVDRFITDPQHVASATGYFKSDLFGGQRPVEQGIFNLFVDNGRSRPQGDVLPAVFHATRREIRSR